MNIHVSDAFKKMTKKAIVAIVLFIFTYLILALFATALTAGCIVGGIAIIVTIPSLLGILLGIGLAGLGVFIFIFLYKFIFKSNKVDRSHLVEIYRKDEPKLFRFIEQVVKEAGTDFPKKIYLSADVNACVFYDSSFWSMFLPIRKNLQIGIGLVNASTEEEIKGILAHEFGHFSQKSMKVGSYVYYVNQIIYNMLFDNDSYQKMVRGWSNISGLFSFFMMIGIKIIQGIQFILGKNYEYININYLALSREMEFHADEVAATIAGSLPLKESLLRSDFADHAYTTVLSFYSGKINENIRSQNIYKEHRFVLQFLAQENQLTIANNLPQLSLSEINKYNKSKLNIKNQWASHPSVEDRVEALDKLNSVKPHYSDQPAILLFSNPEKTERRLTNKLFSSVTYQEKPVELELEDFEHEYTENFNNNRFPKIYNGYYDNKNPLDFDIENVASYSDGSSYTLEKLFNKDRIEQVYELIGLESDKQILSDIVAKKIQLQSFDYDGKKYTVAEAKTLLSKLDLQLKNSTSLVRENDINIFTFFYYHAQRNNSSLKLKQKYKDFFSFDKEYATKTELSNKLMEATQFISVETPFEQIEQNFKTLYKLEGELKSDLRKLLQTELLTKDITPAIRESLETYLSNDLVYFRNEQYFTDNLQIFFEVLHHYNYLVPRLYFLIKQELVKFQAEQLK